MLTKWSKGNLSKHIGLSGHDICSTNAYKSDFNVIGSVLVGDNLPQRMHCPYALTCKVEIAPVLSGIDQNQNQKQIENKTSKHLKNILKLTSLPSMESKWHMA